jgi:TonB family protein
MERVEDNPISDGNLFERNRPVLVSVAVHGSLLLLAWFLGFVAPIIDAPQDLPTAPPLPVRMLTAQALRELGGGKNIVESQQAPQPLQTDAPADYMGERTQRVERETVAPGFGSASGGRTKGPPKALDAAPVRKTPLDLSGRGLALPREATPPPPTSKGTTQEAGEGGDGNLRKGSLDALPKNVAVGADTLLNTDEYVYAGFFNRMKQEVAPRWEPMVRDYLKRANIESGVYTSQAVFFLDSAGKVARIEIARSSGAKVLDDIARDAIRLVSRMPNPPTTLQQSDGLYRVELGFIVTFDKKRFNTEYVPDSRYMRRMNP